MPELSHGAYLAWQFAAGEAARAMHQFIEKEFVLLGVCSLGKWLHTMMHDEEMLQEHKKHVRALQTEVAALEEVFKACAVTPTSIRHAVRTALGEGAYQHTKKVMHRSVDCRLYFQRAEALAASVGAYEVSCMYLLAALLAQPGNLLTGILASLDVDIAIMHAKAVAALESSPEQDSGENMMYAQHLQTASTHQITQTLFLEQYGHDLTQDARDGKMDPIVGRKEEILAVVRVLNQKIKNIPILVSEPGVSRIAVVKGLAMRMAHGDIVAPIRGKRIIEWHLGEIGPRSHIEQSLQRVIDEASRDPDIIVFIDDIHTLVGAGSVEISFESTSMLRMAIGRGRIRCIGATTVEYYRRYIEADPLLERCCQAIAVHEPTREEMQDILQYVCPRYVEHHHVTIPPEIVDFLLELTTKYMPDKRFPEKALDVLDQACARARITQITQREGEEVIDSSREVTREILAAVVADKTGVPLGRLLETARDKLRRLAQELNLQIGSNT